MAVTPVQSTKTVATAGTAVQLSTNVKLFPASVYLESVAGTIYVGLSNVSSTNYIAKLTAGQGITISAAGVGVHYRSGSQGIQLSSLYIDAASNGDKCQVTYMNEQG